MIIQKLKSHLITGTVCLGIGAIASSVISSFKPSQTAPSTNLAVAANVTTELKIDPIRQDLTNKLQACYRLGGYRLPDSLNSLPAKDLNNLLYECNLRQS
ncbi:hypothetical protein TUMEXPCC7403_25245 [Tumidithrix helvetica PCC 7403]|uniref:hypothetical protein n=1 Tax=Tumidithrix helvetica TaxID=3457545 RepID=UPI003C95DC80